MEPLVLFENVSKKFRRGERHDSLRDLVPSLVRGLLRPQRPEALGDQEFWAIRNVTFRVRAGEALGIIGRNGAGKSTTLKLLTRILRPTSGRCGVYGRAGALIEVASGFHPDLTGRENVFLQGAIMGMKRAEVATRFDEIVDFAGVENFIDTPVKRYSSGMNARLGFSIAAHLRPDVLIIDEVLSVGDMAFQQKCFDRMMEFKRRGVAIVLVSHNLQAVGQLCDEAIHLDGGVKAHGPAEQVLRSYVQALPDGEPQGSVQSGLTISSASYLNGEGPPSAHRDVPPGTPLTLRVRLSSEQALDDITFGFLVYRSTDQLLVYDGNVSRRDLSEVPLDGDMILDFTFRANVVRGHYYVSLHVFHNPTQQFLVRPRQFATFGVQENRSYAGVADVDLSTALACEETA